MGGLLASRRRVVLSTLVLLLVLDLGRSLYARIGYARPVQVWQPDPAVYADLTWPPGADVPTTAPLGQRIYATRCAVCHGPDGRGNGPAAPSMIPHPRDFTRGEFKYKSTPAGQPPTDEDLIQIVRDGLHASAMPYWRDLLSEEEIRAVIAQVKNFAPSTFQTASLPVAITPRTSSDEASRGRGQQLYRSMCASCHGIDGRLQAPLKDAKGYPVVARDLTTPWTFRGGSSPEQIWVRLTTGLPPGPMPSFAASTTPEQRWDLVNYVLSLARVPPWAAGGRLDGPGQRADLVERGRYLVHASMCGLCHTPINRTGIYRGDDFYLAGGMRVGAYPHGYMISRNLTSDPDTGLGRWSEDQIIAAMLTGRAPDRLLNVWDMPWNWLHGLHPDDAQAIARYLKTTLPPVHHSVAGPLHYGVLETIVMKLARGLPAANPQVLTFANGVFGRAEIPQDIPLRIMISAQWIVLLLGVVAYQRIPAKPGAARRSRWARNAGLLGIVVIGLVGWALYATPMIRIIPPEQITSASAPDPPKSDPTKVTTSEQGALADRGRYLFTTTSCALCHQSNGAGGSKISWKPFGTLWSRNITPDPDTGIGKWTDEQIARAIRSGVAADGRMLHWQGMIWDHLSNLDEEDVRALIVYLRTLPPVRRPIPPARPPAPDDCDIYSFWTVPSTTPGCR